MKYANVLLIAALAGLTACDKTDETINPKIVEEAKRVAQKGVVQLGDAAIRVLQEHNNKQNENAKHGWPTFDTNNNRNSNNNVSKRHGRTYKEFQGWGGELVGSTNTCNNHSTFRNTNPAVAMSIANSAQVLCYSQNTVGYSNLYKTGVWSAEHLTRDMVKRARQQSREDSFHEDDRIEVQYRATLRDYQGSGYDRGHLFPNGDTVNRTTQYDSFSLANMIPQVAKHNRGIWSSLEENTRKAVSQRGEAYIVTGSSVRGETEVIGNGVVVPTQIWKAVYFPLTQETGAVITDNKDNAQYRYVSVENLTKEIGIDPFPAVYMRYKQKVLRW